MQSIEKLRIIAKAKLSNKKKLGNWYKDRLDLCKECPLNTTNKPELTTKEKAMLVVNLGKPTCVGCGCEIAAKASVRGEQCGLVHKGLEPLWTALPELEDVSLLNLKVTNLDSDKINLEIEKRGISIDYGTVMKGFNSNVKFSLKSKLGPITNVKTVSGCGCTTAISSDDNGEAIIHVGYDTVGRIGAARKSINIYYNAGNKKHSLRCTLNINVLK